jgi:hypothetical protein
MARRATRVLAANRWSHDLTGRDRDYKLFKIPEEVVVSCDVSPCTNRSVRIELSTGAILRWSARVTSGTEIYFPTAYRENLRAANSVECEIEN